jgi:hypothetical protein
MHLSETFTWAVFCVAFGIMLLLNFLMSLQNRKFFRWHMGIAKFGMLDLEFPSSGQDLNELINEIYKLPGSLPAKTVRAVKTQLKLDFLYMIFGYGAVFVLCFKVSMKLSGFGHHFFSVLAWLQCIAIVCDIFENVYLIYKLRPGLPVPSKLMLNLYLLMEVIKWGLPLTAVVCSTSAIAYFWFAGNFSDQSLLYFGTAVLEILIYLLIRKITATTDQQDLDRFLKTV